MSTQRKTIALYKDEKNLLSQGKAIVDGSRRGAERGFLVGTEFTVYGTDLVCKLDNDLSLVPVR